MSTARFHGILAAVVTPLTADAGDLDPAAIRDQVDHILGAGIQGLVPGGSTGEFAALTLDERRRSHEAYLEAAAGRGTVVLGTGALSTRDTIDLTRHAAESGADAVMVVPPFYDTLSWEELLAHYGAVSEAVDIPIMYYNLPSHTGVELTAEQFAELGRRTNVTAFKDTSGDAVTFGRVLLEHADVIQPLNGYDTLSFAGLALGAEASVWGTASVIPELCARFYTALATEGDLVEARRLWTLIEPVCTFLESHNYAAAIKAGLELVGHGAGPTRAPILPLAPEHRAELAGLLTAAGVAVVTD